MLALLRLLLLPMVVVVDTRGLTNGCVYSDDDDDDGGTVLE